MVPVQPHDAVYFVVRRIRVHRKNVVDMDAPDDEDGTVQLYLADCLAAETTASGWDLARLERAAQRAEQSARGGRHDVIQGRGVWLRHVG